MAHFNFSWTTAVDDKHPTLVYRLYEDGELAVDDIGELTFSLLMDGKEEKEYEYYVTSVDPTATDPRYRESAPSNKVRKALVLPEAPQPPKGFSVEFSSE